MAHRRVTTGTSARETNSAHYDDQDQDAYYYDDRVSNSAPRAPATQPSASYGRKPVFTARAVEEDEEQELDDEEDRYYDGYDDRQPQAQQQQQQQRPLPRHYGQQDQYVGADDCDDYEDEQDDREDGDVAEEAPVATYRYPGKVGAHNRIVPLVEDDEYDGRYEQDRASTGSRQRPSDRRHEVNDNQDQQRRRQQPSQPQTGTTAVQSREQSSSSSVSSTRRPVPASARQPVGASGRSGARAATPPRNRDDEEQRDHYPQAARRTSAAQYQQQRQAPPQPQQETKNWTPRIATTPQSSQTLWRSVPAGTVTPTVVPPNTYRSAAPPAPRPTSFENMRAALPPLPPQMASVSRAGVAAQQPLGRGAPVRQPAVGARGAARPPGQAW